MQLDLLSDFRLQKLNIMDSSLSSIILLQTPVVFWDIQLNFYKDDEGKK